jgi:hypothetical protein
MPTILTENNLQFTFDNDWVVIKFDGTPESDCLKAIPDTKITDIIGVYMANKLVLVEIKDPRGHEVAYLAQLQDPAKAQESPVARAVSGKFRDGLSGIVLSARHGAPSLNWTPFLAAVGNTGVQIVCVVWLEEQAAAQLPQWKAHCDFFFKKLKQYMAKLPVQVMRVSLVDYQNYLTGLTAQDMAAGAVPAAGAP